MLRTDYATKMKLEVLVFEIKGTQSRIPYTTPLTVYQLEKELH